MMLAPTSLSGLRSAGLSGGACLDAEGNVVDCLDTSAVTTIDTADFSTTVTATSLCAAGTDTWIPCVPNWLVVAAALFLVLALRGGGSSGGGYGGGGRR
jgi:hypothetical protein